MNTTDSSTTATAGSKPTANPEATAMASLEKMMAQIKAAEEKGDDRDAKRAEFTIPRNLRASRITSDINVALVPGADVVIAPYKPRISLYNKQHKAYLQSDTKGNLMCKTDDENAPGCMWEISRDSLDAQYYHIKNAFTGMYIHYENGKINGRGLMEDSRFEDITDDENLYCVLIPHGEKFFLGSSILGHIVPVYSYTNKRAHWKITLIKQDPPPQSVGPLDESNPNTESTAALASSSTTVSVSNT